MKAFTYIQQGKFGFTEKGKPTIIDEHDAIVRVTLSSICTSDLHIKYGSVPRAVPGITVGHEMEIGESILWTGSVNPGRRLTLMLRNIWPKALKIIHIMYSNSPS